MEHMMHEYERLWRASSKPTRLRIFIFQALSHSLSSSTWSNRSDDVKSEKERFIEALNSALIMAATLPEAPPAALQTPAVTSNVDFLFGLEKSNAMAGQLPAQNPSIGKVAKVEEPVVRVPVMDEQFIELDPIQKHIHDLQKLKIEEQQGVHQRKIDDNLSGMPAIGDCFKAPDKMTQFQTLDLVVPEIISIAAKIVSAVLEIVAGVPEIVAVVPKIIVAARKK